MISKLLKMQMLDEDDELAYSTSSAPEEKEQKEADGRPAWMRQLHSSLSTWLQLVPKVSSILLQVSFKRCVLWR